MDRDENWKRIERSYRILTELQPIKYESWQQILTDSYTWHITDEFIIRQFQGHGELMILPFWLSWIAIFIDYLELPVMYDTTKRFLLSFRKNLVNKQS